MKELLSYSTFNTKPHKKQEFTYFQNIQYGNYFIFNEWKNNFEILKVSNSVKTARLEIIVDQSPYIYFDTSQDARITIHDPCNHTFFQKVIFEICELTFWTQFFFTVRFFFFSF